MAKKKARKDALDALDMSNAKFVLHTTDPSIPDVTVADVKWASGAVTFSGVFSGHGHLALIDEEPDPLDELLAAAGVEKKDAPTPRGWVAIQREQSFDDTQAESRRRMAKNYGKSGSESALCTSADPRFPDFSNFGDTEEC